MRGLTDVPWVFSVGEVIDLWDPVEKRELRGTVFANSISSRHSENEGIVVEGYDKMGKCLYVVENIQLQRMEKYEY